MAVEVGVVGAGIIGLTTALRILETLSHVRVSVVAESFTPHTTADVAAGLFGPYLIDGLTDEKLRDWCVESYNFYLQLIRTQPGEQIGLALTPAYEYSDTYTPRPLYADAYLEYRDLTPEELAATPGNYQYGSYAVAITFVGKKLLPYLMERFLRAGGRFVTKKLTSLDELADDYDVVVNCPGVGAASLVPDPDVTPAQGQTIRVRAPWIKNAIIAGTYEICPTVDYVVLGGSLVFGETSLVPDSEVAKDIWKNCLQLVPSLKDAEILTNHVGLRPYRSPLRLEIENRVINVTGKTLPIVHHYGHGGSGITVSWGAAGDAVKLLQDVIQSRNWAIRTSKL
ncbi:D-amino-acid oxidase [Ixodes scapularis]